MNQNYKLSGSRKRIGIRNTIRYGCGILCTALLIVTSNLKAQVSNYTFGNATGTYTALTSATTWQSGSQLNTDAISGQIPLGFTFRFNHKNYTSIAISNNGYIVFGTDLPTSSTLANYPISRANSTTTTPANKSDGLVAGLGVDLVASTRAGAVPSIQYGTSGSDFVVQYTDLTRSGLGTTGSETIKFQIRLTPTTNVITIIYGGIVADTALSSWIQVGLSGASLYDWKGLTSTNSTGTAWTSPTVINSAGTAAHPTGADTGMRFHASGPAGSTTYPLSGRTYTFTPPASLAAPTYAVIPATQNFDSWVNGNSTANLPEANSWRTWPAYGDRSWRRHDVTAATAGWSTSTATGQVAISSPAAGGVARFHSNASTTGSTGFMDLYVNLSTPGVKDLAFDYFNASGSDNLKVYLSTDGGATFGSALNTYGVAANWATQTLVIGSSTSATAVIRFEATSQLTSADIAIDNVSVTVQCTPVLWYADADADGFGNPAISLSQCAQPVGYVSNNSDCDDNLVLYLDTDGDGFGSLIKVACGGVTNSSDCNDTVLTYSDVDNDGFGSTTLSPCGVSNNSDCNDNQLQYVDADGDTFGSTVLAACGVLSNTDCNDNQLQYVDADNDGFGSNVLAPCGVTNNSDCNDNQLQYVDADNDGFGSTTLAACGVTNNSDCNDAQLQYVDSDNDGFGSTTFAACGVTNNSDCNDAQIQYVDADNDGFGSTTLAACGVTNNSDCNDAQLQYIDSDNDGFGSTILAACGVTNNLDCNDAQLQYIDSDNDGFGSTTLVACGVINNTDCNDNLTLYADGDGDGFGSTMKVACNGVTNNVDCNDNEIRYADADGDGFGSTTLIACGGVLNDADCNDNQIRYADADGDGFGSITMVPCDGVLNTTDCNDSQLTYVDGDNDGYGSTTPAPCGANNNNDCDDTKAFVNPGAVEVGYNLIDDDCDGSIDEGFAPKVTNVQSALCGTILSAINSQIIANLIAGAQGYRWRVTTLTGSNSGQIQFLDTQLRAMKLTQLATYAYDTQYKIEVAVYYAGYLQPFSLSNCSVSTPAVTTQLVTCGQVLANIADPIYAAIVAYAGGYRFKISDPINSANTQVVERQIRDFRMSLVTNFVVQFNKTYNIEVSVKNTDGTWLPYGQVCQVTTPQFPTTSIVDFQCNDYPVPSNNTQIYAASYPGAIAYVFQLTGPGITTPLEVTKSLRAFTLNDFSGLIPGATYNVKVRLIFNSTDPAGPYGKTCTIVTPGVARVADSQKEFDVKAFPNPFEETFSIVLNSPSKDKINMRIYDAVGRLVDSRWFEAGIAEIQAGNQLPSGIYTIIVAQGEQKKICRLIKR
jgi:hypothetical protein